MISLLVFLCVMCVSALAWLSLGNVCQRLHIPVKINYQLALIVFGVLAIVYYLILFQQPIDFLIDTSKHHVKRTLYARVGAKETEFQTLFTQGMMGYNTSRIPALVYHKDTFLAFCEARKDTSRDVGKMDIILRRGKRRGMEVEWGNVQIVATRKGYRSMNPVPIVDKNIDVIVLVFIQIPAYIDQLALLRMGIYNQQVLVTRSFDTGETWSIPEDITDSTIGRMRPRPALFAPGPGHGIQTSSGRLIVPGNYFVKDEIGELLHYLDNFEDTTNYANVIFSDDNGATWSMGGRMPFGVDPLWRPIHSGEAMVVEIDNGHLVLNARTMHADLTRVQSRSTDEGETFGAGDLIQELVEPGYKISHNYTIPSKTGGCQASLVGFPAPANEMQSNVWVLFSNPAMQKFRERMSIRISKDGCKQWSRPWTIHPLASGYSDLAYFEERDPVSKFNSQNFGIIFEGGKNFVYESIMFKMFNLEALERGLEIVKMHDKRPWDNNILNQSDDVLHKKQRGQHQWLNLV